MICVNNNLSLSSLFFDVHHVLSEASKEFHNIEYRFDFDSKNRGVIRVRFLFTFRKSYYSDVYPDKVALFEHLDMLRGSAFSGLSFVRHVVRVFVEDGLKKYSVVLYYGSR